MDFLVLPGFFLCDNLLFYCENKEVNPKSLTLGKTVITRITVVIPKHY